MDPVTLAIIQVIIGLVSLAASTLLKSAQQTKSTPTAYEDTYKAGGNVPQSFAVGTVGVRGKLEYDNTYGTDGDTPNAWRARVFSLSDLPINAVTGFFADTQRVTKNTDHADLQGYAIPEFHEDGKDYLWWKIYDGSQTTADSYLTGVFGSDADRPWTSGMVGRGVGYAIVTALLNNNLYQGQFPDFIFDVQGIKLYDPRKDGSAGGTGLHRLNSPSTWEFSDNPIVIIYNILLGIYYYDGSASTWMWGSTALRNADATIDTDAVAYALPYSSWATAMSICDIPISLVAGGTEPQFRVGREISVDEQPADIISELLVACNGRISEGAGVYRVAVGVLASAVTTFTDADVIVSEDQTLEPFPALDQMVNGATATYSEPYQAWAATEAAPFYNADLEAEDDGRRQVVGLDLKSVISQTQAQRVQRAVVLEGRRRVKHLMVLRPLFGVFQPLDTIAWTSSRNGYTAKAFLVTSVEEAPNGNVILNLQEIDPTDHDWDPETNEQEVTYAPLTPIVIGAQVTSGWTVAPAYMEDSDGNPWLPSIAVGFDLLLTDVRSVRIQVREGWGDKRLIFDGSIDYPSATTPQIINAQFVAASLYEARGLFVPGTARRTRWSNQDEDGTEGAWLSTTTPLVAPVPKGSITTEEVSKLIEDIVLFVVGIGDPGSLSDSIFDAIDEVAGSVVTNTMASDRDRRAIQSTVGDVSAAVVQEAQTRASEDTALAQYVNEVAAQAASGLAEGLFTVQAIAAPAGVSVRLALMGRVTTADDFVQAGFFIDILPDGAGGYVSQIIAQADKMYWTDGSTKTVPMSFIGGVLSLNVANIGTVTAGLLKNSAGTSFFNLGTGAFRIST